MTQSVIDYLNSVPEFIVLPHAHEDAMEQRLLRTIMRKIRSYPELDHRADSGDPDRESHPAPTPPDGDKLLETSPTGASAAEAGRPFRRAVTLKVGTPRPGTLRLWLIQELSVWEMLQERGTLLVDRKRCVNFEDVPWAYEWMRDQMVRRLPGCEGRYPWWAWHRPKPDLRRWHARNYPVSSRGVRLELAIPAERVLLSHEPMWYYVLNRWPALLTDAEEREWEAESTRSGRDPLDQRLPEPWLSRVVGSWERVFDLEAIAATGEWSDAVQATFERLDLCDVVAVTEFWGRG